MHVLSPGKKKESECVMFRIGYINQKWTKYFRPYQLRVVQEGEVQICWSLFETDGTKTSAGITVHNISRVSTASVI